MSTPSTGDAPRGAHAVATQPQPYTHRQIQVILIGLLSGMLLAALDQASLEPRFRASCQISAVSITCPGS